MSKKEKKDYYKEHPLWNDRYGIRIYDYSHTRMVRDLEKELDMLKMDDPHICGYCSNEIGYEKFCSYCGAERSPF